MIYNNEKKIFFSIAASDGGNVDSGGTDTLLPFVRRFQERQVGDTGRCGTSRDKSFSKGYIFKTSGISFFS